MRHKRLFILPYTINPALFRATANAQNRTGCDALHLRLKRAEIRVSIAPTGMRPHFPCFQPDRRHFWCKLADNISAKLKQMHLIRFAGRVRLLTVLTGGIKRGIMSHFVMPAKIKSTFNMRRALLLFRAWKP